MVETSPSTVGGGGEVSHDQLVALARRIDGHEDSVDPQEIWDTLQRVARAGGTRSAPPEGLGLLAQVLRRRSSLVREQSPLGARAATTIGLLMHEATSQAWATVIDNLRDHPFLSTVDNGRAFLWAEGFRDPRLGVPDDVFEITDRIKVRAAVEEVRWSEDGCVLGGFAHFSHLVAGDEQRVTVVLRARGHEDVRVEASRVRRPDRVKASGPELNRLAWSGFSATVPETALKAPRTWHVYVELDHEGLVRTEPLRVARPSMLAGSVPFVVCRQGRRAVVARTTKGALVLDAAASAKRAGTAPSTTSTGPRAKAAQIARRFVLSPGRSGSRRRTLRTSDVGGTQTADVPPKMSLPARKDSPSAEHKLSDDVYLVSTGEHPQVKKLRDDTWLLGVTGSSGTGLDAHAVADGWLVAPAGSPPEEALRLETETLRLLGGRHIAWLLGHYGVDCVLDVGANKGQYGRSLRRHGYDGHIVSFEPVPDYFEELSAAAARDDRWTVHQMALGSVDGTAPIHVQRTFSSLLKSSDYGMERFATLRQAADNDIVVDVPLRRLDGILDSVLEGVTGRDGGAPTLFLKMDTQGFDVEAFRGLGERVSDFVAMQSEVALLTIYRDMPRMCEALAVYEGAGFAISGLFPVTREKDGRIIEYDCVMVRSSAPA